MLYPGLLHPELLPLQQSTDDPYLQETLKPISGSASMGFQGLCEPSNCLWWVWGLILNAILSLLPSFGGFSFALEFGVSFFHGIQHSPVNSCSAASCNFEILTGEDENRSDEFPQELREFR